LENEKEDEGKVRELTFRKVQKVQKV